MRRHRATQRWENCPSAFWGAKWVQISQGGTCQKKALVRLLERLMVSGEQGERRKDVLRDKYEVRRV